MSFLGNKHHRGLVLFYFSYFVNSIVSKNSRHENHYHTSSLFCFSFFFFKYKTSKDAATPQTPSRNWEPMNAHSMFPHRCFSGFALYFLFTKLRSVIFFSHSPSQRHFLTERKAILIRERSSLSSFQQVEFSHDCIDPNMLF